MNRHAVRVAAVLSAFAAIAAQAQNYPTKPIRMVVPFTPGGAQDVMGRLMGAKIAEATGQQVIIDNRPGAGGVIGMELIARGAPDGYTLGVGAFGTLAINPSLYPKLPYDAFKSFTPVTLYAKVPNLLTVGNSVPARSVKELIALAKAKPGMLSYGSGGQGSGIHLTTEYFRLMAKIELTHVPYKGTVPAAIAMMSGEVSMVFAAIQGLAPHVRSGKIRGLGVSTSKRLPSFPDIPTIAEDGLPGFEATQWYGLVAPTGLPKPVLAALHKIVVGSLQTKDVQDRLAFDSSEAVGNQPDEFRAFIKLEIDRWAPVVKASGIKPE